MAKCFGRMPFTSVVVAAGIDCWPPFAAVVLLASEGASIGFARLLGVVA